MDQSFIDFFDDKGQLVHRLDISILFDNYESLELLKLEKIRLPKLIWSCRHQMNLNTKSVNGEPGEYKEKLIVSGTCSYRDQSCEERPFLMKLTVKITQGIVETLLD